ncbi:WD repeat-containing and planar cell polarity effector protein fritz-like [Diabrotica virgifera virgifera]|uniref:WD repeat-containing and planar cell polarity effector protein fritz-like n=1 Tax=Diabrotica virgifera virgifera TaxID=50390 RepID=A0A6P7FJ90_DIAVI|nr:WD repeat-containing and planar cell polarity effector protein fritz-like [Diabrotica virgifera virgifera]
MSHSNSKKNQPKVKFSDTLTDFIVPEIKRPQRPAPPPSHVTDPQKELADSLPLCHPNEDYLKDFTPVKKEDTDGDGDSEQPKSKVIHFGVV